MDVIWTSKQRWMLAGQDVFKTSLSYKKKYEILNIHNFKARYWRYRKYTLVLAGKMTITTTIITIITSIEEKKIYTLLYLNKVWHFYYNIFLWNAFQHNPLTLQSISYMKPTVTPIPFCIDGRPWISSFFSLIMQLNNY